jgi:protein-disulfide isomerase
VAAYATEAAYRQGKFWEMHDLIFESQEEWSSMSSVNAKKLFAGFAARLNLDLPKFEADSNSREVAELVDLSYVGGAKAGVDSTPDHLSEWQENKS